MKRNDELSYRSLILFSLPSIFSSLLEPLSGLVDTAFVGNKSSLWLAGLGVAATIFNAFSWVFNFLVHASIQGISESFSRGDENKVAMQMRVSLIVACGVGLLSFALLYSLRFYLYDILDTPNDVIGVTEEYFTYRLIGMPFAIVYLTLHAFLRGVSKVKESFYLILITTGLNIFLNYIFLYYFNYGIFSVGLGTSIANILGVIIGGAYLIYVLPFRKQLLNLSFEKATFFRFGKNSLNIFGRSLFLTSAFFLGTKAAGGIGVTSLAAHQVILQLWLFISFFVDGIAISANILGAKFYGLKDLASFFLLKKRLIHISLFIGIAASVIFLIFKYPILGLFTQDIEVVAVIISIWILITLAQPFNSYSFILDGLVFGVEGFDFLRKHMFIGVVFLFLPCVYLGYINKSLIFVWSGLFVLSLYRGASGTYFLTEERLLKRGR